MKLGKLMSLVAGGKQNDAGYYAAKRAGDSVPRWLAQVGVELPDLMQYQLFQSEIEIPMDAVQAVLALDQGERATADLRAMGEGFGRANLSIPSNINVWQHLKGESTLASAARALTDAANQVAKAATK
jgi:hypothetical protein